MENQMEKKMENAMETLPKWKAVKGFKGLGV